MKGLSFLSLLIFGLAGVPSQAQTGFASSLIHGNSCFNGTPGTTLNYNQYGPYNSGKTGITVYCPLGLPDEPYTSIRYFVTGWSRNSSVNKLSCTLYTTGSDGSAAAGSVAVVPYNVSAAKTGSAITYPTANISPFPYLSCYIPPPEAGMDSYLSTIIVRAFY